MINFIVFDFDGVFTNGNIFYSNNGKQSKYYNVKDGMAIKLLKDKYILSGIISSHPSKATLNIAKHLKFDRISIGSDKNKLDILTKWKKELNFNWNEIAFIGDDIADIECLYKVGFAACPSDAVDEVKKYSNYICNNKGGKCAVREFVEHIIDSNNSSPFLY